MLEELNGDFLQWLRGFYYVAKTGSLRKAAELMRRNPSTISYQLRSLEEELGTVLFDRHKKTLRITPEGKNLLEWTVSTFETLQGLRSSVGSISGGLQGNIAMAATLPIMVLVEDCIAEFIREHPKIHLTIRRGLSHEARQYVTDAEVDFGLIPLINKPEHDNFTIVFKARPVLVTHKSNRYNIPRVPEISDLKKLPYVSFLHKTSPDELGYYIEKAGMGDFIRSNAVIQINNYHLILRFIREKLGVSIMDELCFQASCYGGDWASLISIPLDHILPNRLYGILSRQGKKISPQAQALIDKLHDSFTSIPGANS